MSILNIQSLMILDIFSFNLNIFNYKDASTGSA
jgi:hypothetical protein